MIFNSPQSYLKMKSKYAAIASFLILSIVQASAGEKPNFVFFLSDDQLKADYGCYGLPVELTPAVDRLAREGLVFDKMFTAEAICAPSRAALLTGLYPIRNGLFVQHTSARRGTKTIYDALTPLGYDVSLIGKVHVKPDSVFRWSTPVRPTKKKLPADDVDAFFLSHANKPFCLFIMSHYPHGPYPKTPGFPADKVVRHPHMQPTADKWLPGYYDHIAEKERELADVLTLLDKHELDQNTVFIYSSDHGNGPGAKFTVYDRGLNVPFIVRWPGKIKPGRTSALTSYTDVLPTFVELAGGQPVAEIDGKSFAAVLKDPEVSHHKYVFGLMTQQGVLGTHIFPRRCSHDGRYHYIHNFNTLEKIRRDKLAGKKIDPFHRLGARKHTDVPEEELFDTQTDPFELTNVAADPTMLQIKARLKRELFSWMDQQNDFLSEAGEIPFLESKHPVDESGTHYTCPPHLIGKVKQFVDPHQLTDPKRRK